MLKGIIGASLAFALVVNAREETKISTGPIKKEGAAMEKSLWTLVTPQAAFSPRDTGEDLVFDGKMWMSNGYYHGNKLSRDLWTSTDGKTWTEVNSATPYDGYSELVAWKGKMWAVKGSVWNSTDGVKWTCVTPKTPFGAQGYGEVVAFQGKMWHLSGADAWNTDDGANWTCVTNNAPYGKRYAAAVAVYRDKLWLMGGSTPEPNNPPETGYKDVTTHNDVWCSADGKNWTKVLDHAPWFQRRWFIAAVYRDKLWIVGGYDNVHAANLGDVWYTEDGKRWEQLASPKDLTFSPRHEPTCYVYDDSLWVVAGNSWPVKNDVWRLTLPK